LGEGDDVGDAEGVGNLYVVPQPIGPVEKPIVKPYNQRFNHIYSSKTKSLPFLLKVKSSIRTHNFPNIEYELAQFGRQLKMSENCLKTIKNSLYLVSTFDVRITNVRGTSSSWSLR